MSKILIPCLILGVIAAILGIILAIASKIFSVQKDERLDKISALLPGANCGGCGFAGCGAYAEAILNGSSPFLCNACGNEARAEISEILGVSFEAKKPLKAKVLCGGILDSAAFKFEYSGLSSCAAASLVGTGPKACDAGCLGFLDCAGVCMNNAIFFENGIAKVSEELCGGCGACVNVCPKKVIVLLPEKASYYVKCNSHKKGAEVTKTCSAGCIGCKLCEKACEFDAIHIIDNLAKIDYEKCTSCGKCAEKCPKKCIVGVYNESN